MSDKFIKALPIYPEHLLKEMNVSLFFVCEINSENKSILKITGNSVYRVFDNGELLGYGPARAAHNFYRIDEFNLKPGLNRLVIELSGYNCNSFYFLNTEPFLQCEVIDNVKNEVLAYTGKDFKCYLNDTRIQKVTRFSYQRTFAESYIFNEPIFEKYLGHAAFLKELDIKILEKKQYLERNISYPKYDKFNMNLVEHGTFEIVDSQKEYEDRYMFTEMLKIFDKKDWEIDSNKIASQMVFTRSQNNINFKNIEVLQGFSFNTYELNVSKTGFINIEVEVIEESEIYLIFDEVDMKRTEDLIDISFYRNTTHNVVTYKLCKGLHKHITMEPYTIKYLRIAVLSGKINVKKLEIIAYENPDVTFKYSYNDEKINTIAEAAINTFKQNAVDILTDCPSRERAGWLCDSYFTSQAEFLLTGKNLVERNFLENYAISEQYPTLPEGMIPMCYPGEFPDGTFIPNWSLYYLLELKDYFDRTHDRSLIDLSKDKVNGLLKYFEKFENELGLLENLENWVFVEWSKANDPEYICGVNFPSNMLYSAALKAVYYLYGDENCLKKAEFIKEQINKFSFNGNFYIDNMIRNDKNEFIKTDHITETCQYYAFYFDIATKETKPDLFDLMLKVFGPKRNENEVYSDIAKSNIIVGDYFRLFILLKYGYNDQIKEEIVDYFYEMAVKTGTLWEHESPWASLNHGLTSVLLNIIDKIY